MIGQKTLLKLIEKQITQDEFPRFSILVGPRGSGKTMLSKKIAEMMHANYIILNDLKIDLVRELIAQSYKIMSKTVYVLNHADEMSLSAKNALLKVMEEPPHNAYFIMTLEDENNTLSTIRSRGSIYKMQNYAKDEIAQFVKQQSARIPTELINTCCETPGDVLLLQSMNADEFLAYVDKVIDNIATCSGPNAFKISKDIKFKDDGEGYDLAMFWRVFSFLSFKRFRESNDAKYLEANVITSDALSILRYKTVNRLMLFDKWILDIREAWM